MYNDPNSVRVTYFYKIRFISFYRNLSTYVYVWKKSGKIYTMMLIAVITGWYGSRRFLISTIVLSI